MNAYNNKKRDYLEMINPKQDDFSIETNVLIREEAEFLAKNFMLTKNDINSISSSNQDSTLNSHLFELDKQSFDNAQKIEQLQEDANESKVLLKRIESLLLNKNNTESDVSNSIPSEDNQLFEEYQNFSSLNSVDNSLPENDLFLSDDSPFLSEENNSFSIDEKNTNDKVNLQINVNEDQPFIFVDEKLNVSVQEQELLESFQKILNLKLEDANLKIESLSDELKIAKESFNSFINDYQYNLESLNSQQKDLVSALNNNIYLDEIKASKENFIKIEKEIEKISSAWVQSNKLLNKLENLIFEISNAKIGYDEDLNALIFEIKDQTVENRSSLLKLNQEIESVKEKLEVLGNKQDDLFIKNNENKDAFDSLRKNVDLLDARNLEKFSLLEQNAEETKKHLETLDIKLKDLMDIENFLDSILSSKLFQKSLESKISNMISDNNNYLGDEFKLRIDHLANRLDLELGDFKQQSTNLNNSLKSLENRVYEMNSDISLINRKNDTKEQLEIIENRFGSLYSAEMEKIKTSIIDLERHIDNFKFDDYQVATLLRDSKELSSIIKDKIYLVVDEKINQIQRDADSIRITIENNLKQEASKIIPDAIRKEVSDNFLKIKNEALSGVYAELTKRDKTIDLHSQEIVRNYETLMKCNTLLDELEFLVNKQTEEIDGLRFDKENSFQLLLEKIISQKEALEKLQKVLSTQIESYDFYNNNSTVKKLLDVWKNDLTSSVIELVKNLVEDEIRKKATLSYVSTPSSSIENKLKGNDFFINRVKDILSRLDNENLKKTFENKVANLDFKINDLKKENPNVKDDDLNWFYEKEYNEFVSAKRKDN
ncbi:MAG: hypothetical protein K2J02_01235 [Malacoplasma sp.]|nr:hypothetical protein [Malacoplasma sp.]